MSERWDRRNSHVSRLSPQVFWLAGSLLIISMASVVIPTIGWRWLIRIASIPGIILIMAFKVMLLKLPLCYLSAGPQTSFLHKRIFFNVSLL
jgi:hypothetical protein